MASSSRSQRQRFYHHYPAGHRLYVCIVDQDRRPFDFTDDTFKYASQLSNLRDACVYADSRSESRADHGCSYFVEIDLDRLLTGSESVHASAEGRVVSVHWLVQEGDEPDIKVDQQEDSCRLRLVSGKFEPLDQWSRERLDETIAFDKRARFEALYRDFILREIDSQADRRERLSTAVRSGDVGLTLRIVAEDLCFWAGNLKQHLLHQVTHLAKDPFFVRMRDVPDDSPLQMSETWIVREWVGAREAFDLLEFYKSQDYARSYASRLDRLHEARIEFGKLVTRYTVEQRGEDAEGVFALDEMRKDLKHMALGHAEHLDRIAAQFDASNRLKDLSTTQPHTAASAALIPAERGHDQQPQPFSGGVMTFFKDRVELCGVDICSGPRSRTRRQILDLLRLQRHDGAFIAYSGEALAAEVGSAMNQRTIAGAVRDLRDDIMEALRNRANLVIGRKDVILSGGTGYRFAESITVLIEEGRTTEITDILEVGDVPNVRDDIVAGVRDVADAPAKARRSWILEQLRDGAQLKAPEVARQFSCSVKTAQRDLAALKDEGAVEFVGAARTGYYRLCGPTGGKQ